MSFSKYQVCIFVKLEIIIQEVINSASSMKQRIIILKRQLMKKTQEQQFLQVKEKLDYYRLPTIFNYEDVHLLSRLLGMLEKQDRKQQKQNSTSSNSNASSASQLNDALRHEIGKVIKQNNKLHMDLISAKEQILALKHNNDKLLIQRSGGNKQTTLLIQAQRKREDELFQQLAQAKFKYNQLMDLVHEDPNIEKQYIKRLMKHKRMEIQQRKEDLPQKTYKKGPHQTITQIEAKMILLQNKLANREAEIMRLQKRSEYDGLNMNKILKDFANHRNDNKMNALQQQVQHLQQENKKMKEQVSYCRKNGGLKEALRQQMRKNHQTINKLSNQNKELKRKVKHKQFDTNSQIKMNNKQVAKALQKVQAVESETQIAKLTISDLNKKIQFLKGQFQSVKKDLEVQQKANQNKDILIQKLKNTEDGSKILAHYEAQSLKQKVEQLQTQLQNYQQKISQLVAENDYHKKQDKLKNEAIQNLQKIVDELMKRNNEKGGVEAYLSQSQSINFQNTIALRRNLTEIKQQFQVCLRQKQRLQRQIQSLLIRFQQKSFENSGLNDELSKLKIRLIQLRSHEQQFSILQRQVQTLQSDLKKQQNFRQRIDEMHKQSQTDKAKLRKQLQQLTQQYEIFEKKTKTHLNTQKMQINELQQSNQMLQIRLNQKDKKAIVYQERMQQLVCKVKALKDQLGLIEDQKNIAIREKHRFQKKYQQLLRIHDEQNQRQLRQTVSDRNDIASYQRQIEKLTQIIANKNSEIQNLKSIYEALRMSESNLLQQKQGLRRQVEKLRVARKSNQDGEQEQ